MSARTRGWLAVVLSMAMLAACTSEPPPDGDDEPPREDVGPPGEREPDPPAEPGQRPEPTDFWIAPDGDDSAPGTEDQPWETFSAALPRLDAGHTLYVMDGDYREQVREPSVASGTPTAPIRIVADEDATPVLEGLFWLRDADYWLVHGLNVTWDADRNQHEEHMVKLSGGTGWEFTGAAIWGAESFAALLVADEPDDWRLGELCVHSTEPTNDWNQDHLIYVNNGLDAGEGVIENSLLFDAPNGSGVKLGGASSDSGGAANVTIRAVTIVDTAQPVLIAWGSRNNVVERSIIVGAGENYAAIRGYELYGEGNVARGNIAFDVDDFFLNDPDTLGVRDGGGNEFPLDPEFEQRGSCAAFQPSEPEIARAAGYTAVTAPREGNSSTSSAASGSSF